MSASDLRPQINIRLPMDDAVEVQQLLRLLAARLTLDTGRVHTIGDAVSVATRRLADELNVTRLLKPNPYRNID